jgi:hypothetical protein
MNEHEVDLELMPVAIDMSTASFIGEPAALLCPSCVWQLDCDECCFGDFLVDLSVISFTSTVCVRHFTPSAIRG